MRRSTSNAVPLSLISPAQLTLLVRRMGSSMHRRPQQPFASRWFRTATYAAGTHSICATRWCQATTNTADSTTTKPQTTSAHEAAVPLALDAAMRLTSPSAAHPATGRVVQDDAATGKEAPEVAWREHWDLETKRPYYHHLRTNKLSWKKPRGFESRFPYYYSRIHEEHALGQRTEEHITNPPVEEDVPDVDITTPSPIPGATPSYVTNPTNTAAAAADGTTATAGATTQGGGPTTAAAAASEAEPIAKPTGPRSLKDRIKDYGAAGVLLYLIIHFTSLGVVFLIMYNGVDLTALARKLGFDIQPSKSGNMAALWVAAIAVNKIFGPLQVLTALALAPSCVPVLRRILVKVYSYNK